MPRPKGGSARALATAMDRPRVCRTPGLVRAPRHSPGLGAPNMAQGRGHTQSHATQGREGTKEHGCHSPAPQSSPVLPGGHRHCPVTLLQEAPLQEQELEQFTPNVPAGHSAEVVRKGLSHPHTELPFSLRVPPHSPLPSWGCWTQPGPMGDRESHRSGQGMGIRGRVEGAVGGNGEGWPGGHSQAGPRGGAGRRCQSARLRLCQASGTLKSARNGWQGQLLPPSCPLDPPGKPLLCRPSMSPPTTEE